MVETGKKKCEFLRGIRKRMADANGIEYSPKECGYLFDCSGTCPFCETEAAELLTLLKMKEAQGCEIIHDDISIKLLNEIGHERSVEDMTDQRQEIQRLEEEQGSPMRGYISSPYDLQE